MPVTFTLAFMPPCVHHEENENHETENEKHDRSRLVLPELLEAVRKVVRLHVPKQSTPPPPNIKLKL